MSPSQKNSTFFVLKKKEGKRGDEVFLKEEYFSHIPYMEDFAQARIEVAGTLNIKYSLPSQRNLSHVKFIKQRIKGKNQDN